MPHAVRVGVEAYVENVAAVAALAERHGARVVLILPPVNLYYAPHRLVDVSDFETSQATWAEILALLERGEVRDARARIEAGLTAHPDRFDYRWLDGLALTLEGRVDEGEERLEQAFEAHPFPERTKFPNHFSLISHKEIN